MRTKLVCQGNLVVETEGKINLLVTFIQWFSYAKPVVPNCLMHIKQPIF